MIYRFGLLLFCAISLTAGGALMTVDNAEAAGFERWVKGFWATARARGISRRTFDTAFKGVTPDPAVLRSTRYQPEFVKPVWEYIERAASDSRVENGRKKLAEHDALFRAIEKRYGVDRHIIAAIWGMESNYGTYKGDKYVIRSLATLAYSGGRYRKFGRQQLIATLKILQRGDTTREKLNGSWAGAMGHTQFIPTTYNAYAVDYTGDGRRDIWDTLADALASTGNYLKVSKWRRGRAWGYEVLLPKGFNTRLAGKRRRWALSTWAKKGVRRADGKPFTHLGDKASLLLPAGAKGPAFLILNNFRSILRYNNADSYALGVGILADRLRGSGPLKTAWPTKDRPLLKKERIALQKRLASLGYKIADFDGIIGPESREAIRAYQTDQGLKVDGFAGLDLLRHVIAVAKKEAKNQRPKNQPQRAAAGSKTIPDDGVAEARKIMNVTADKGASGNAKPASK